MLFDSLIYIAITIYLENRKFSLKVKAYSSEALNEDVEN
jgi:hypothetical protein